MTNIAILALAVATAIVAFLFVRAKRKKGGDSAAARVPSNGSQRLAWIKLGEPVTLWHPERGELTVCPLGRIVYQELTQRQRGPQNPWLPTGNAFLSFRLEERLVLLNWLNRFYLLDSRLEVTDDDIRRSFAPHARKFGDADQNALVEFEYPSSVKWRVDDIGRFRLSSVSGEWFPVEVGAEGRFLHASGEGSRALVVEDFDSGGRDVVWKGYLIGEDEIRGI
jgi:hypothetical protein